jgi:hypothetical protein
MVHLTEKPQADRPRTDAAPAAECAPKLVIRSQLGTAVITGDYVFRLQQVGKYLTPLRAPIARQLVGRGRLRQLTTGNGEWWLKRGAKLGIPLESRWQWGQDHRITLMNSETGVLVDVCTCRQISCPDCEASRASRLRRRIAVVVGLHDARERAAGREPVLLTYTIRDPLVASPAAAVHVFRVAMPQMRAELARQGVGAAYVRVEEFTPGVVGHVHWHVVCWLPPWVDYAALHRAWWRALALAGVGVDAVTVTPAQGRRGRQPARAALVEWHASEDCGSDRDDGQRAICGAEPCSRHTPGTLNIQRREQGTSTAQDATGYITKISGACGAIAYALKGEKGRKSVSTEDDFRRFAEYYAGRYMQRRFQTSRQFWRGGVNAVGQPVVPDSVFASEWEPLAATTGDWPDRQHWRAGWAFAPEFAGAD